MGRHQSGLVSLRLIDNLPFVSVSLVANNHTIILGNVLLDTGSAGSIFLADRMLDLGLKPSVNDMLHVISGVGGNEYAFSKVVDTIKVGSIILNNFKVEIGAMDYGFDIDGILGMSFLLPIGAKIDLENLTLCAKDL